MCTLYYFVVMTIPTHITSPHITSAKGLGGWGQKITIFADVERVGLENSENLLTFGKWCLEFLEYLLCM